ncbi:hypothetical protein [Streptomyces sp. NPDC015130]|uniref:hypothetical protein n=1 Tax=Streptomyces sp. NPDC015130 TaxID=3364940 RepID=UPI0036FDE8BC
MPPTLDAATDNGVDQQFQASFGELGAEASGGVEGGEAVQGAPDEFGEGAGVESARRRAHGAATRPAGGPAAREGNAALDRSTV